MAADYKVRGVSKREEVDNKKYWRDPRTPFQKFIDAVTSPEGFSFSLLFIGVVLVVEPAAFELSILFFGILFLAAWGKVKRAHLPMSLPIESGKIDYNDPKPERKEFERARGIYYLGNDQLTNEEVHVSAADLLTHMLLFATTGGGKTEFLLSLAVNSLSTGSGVVFIDPKGTAELELKVWTLARIMGRDDDFLLINYSTGNRAIKANSPDRISNTSNIFAHGTADFLSDIMVSLIPTSEGDNAIFSERAITLMKSLMMSLVELRDQRKINLSVRTIRDWMTMEKCIDIVNDQSLSQVARSSMEAFLNSTAGFQKDLGAKQGEDTMKQFGYAQAYFTRALSSLTDTYGHVYGSIMGEVDYRDVVFNRRILLVLLPSMEKAPPELKALGKIVLAAMRSAMAGGLGNVFEGNYEEMVGSLPSASNCPFPIIADEYGYVATEGFAITAAQARGLGFACIFAGQDYAGFKRGSEAEAESILANTKVKTIGVLEDAQSTWDVVRVLGGETSVVSADSLDSKEGNSPGYMERGARLTHGTQRINLRDLRSQIMGEFHILHKDSIIRIRSFYAAPNIKAGASMQINRMIEVDRPTVGTLAKKYGKVKSIVSSIRLFLDEETGEGDSGKRRSLVDLVVDAPVELNPDSSVAAIKLMRRMNQQKGVALDPKELAFACILYGCGMGRDLSFLDDEGDASEYVAHQPVLSPEPDPVTADSEIDTEGGSEAAPVQTQPTNKPITVSLDDLDDDDEFVVDEPDSSSASLPAAEQAKALTPDEGQHKIEDDDEALAPVVDDGVSPMDEFRSRVAGVAGDNLMIDDLVSEVNERVKGQLPEYPSNPVPDDEPSKNIRTMSTLNKLNKLRKRSKASGGDND
jgi:intracellular multiplication protein IcmO